MPRCARRSVLVSVVAALVALSGRIEAGSVPVRARHGMVVSQDAVASQVGATVLRGGGNAFDAAVATAFGR